MLSSSDKGTAEAKKAGDCQTEMKKVYAGNGYKFLLFTGEDGKLYMIIVEELSFIISSDSS